MIVDVKENESDLTVKLNGRFDTEAAYKNAANFDNLVTKSHKPIFLDFTKMVYICSSGLRLLLTLHKKLLVAGRQLTILHPNEAVKDVFKITGFNKLLNIKD